MMPGATALYAMSLMITSKGAFFLTDTHVHDDPSAAQIAEMALMCARHVRRFGIEPKIALVAHSDFGSHDDRLRAEDARSAGALRERAPDLEIDGEMQADTALSQAIRDRVLPNSRLKGEANVLVMPNLDSANIAFQMAKSSPMPSRSARSSSASPSPRIFLCLPTARGIVNMTAIAVAEAQSDVEAGQRLAAQ